LKKKNKTEVNQKLNQIPGPRSRTPNLISLSNLQTLIYKTERKSTVFCTVSGHHNLAPPWNSSGFNNLRLILAFLFIQYTAVADNDFDGSLCFGKKEALD